MRTPLFPDNSETNVNTMYFFTLLKGQAMILRGLHLHYFILLHFCIY